MKKPRIKNIIKGLLIGISILWAIAICGGVLSEANSFGDFIEGTFIAFVPLLVLWLLPKISSAIKRYRNDEMKKNERNLWLLLILIVLGMFILYWTSIRPASIRKDCYHKATGNINYVRYYQACLMKNGLSPE